MEHGNMAKPAIKKASLPPPKPVAVKSQPTEVAVAANLKVPSYLKDYRGPIGTENIENEDITIPRLKIGQSMSDEVKTGAVEEGSLYINVTSQALWTPGDDPILGLIVAQSKEYVLWRDQQDNGGGILARAKPERTPSGVRYRWDKPNQRFENKVGGKVKVVWETKTFVDENDIAAWGSEIPGDKESGPAATAHHNYLLYLPFDNVVAAISLTKSAVKVARNLNTVLKMGSREIPIFARKMLLSSVDETGGEFTYKNWQIKPNGILDENDPEQVGFAKIARGYFEEYFKGDYIVEQSGNSPSMEETGGTTNVPF
jgi:hypothetical protein